MERSGVWQVVMLSSCAAFAAWGCTPDPSTPSPSRGEARDPAAVEPPAADTPAQKPPAPRPDPAEPQPPVRSRPAEARPKPGLTAKQMEELAPDGQTLAAWAIDLAGERPADREAAYEHLETLGEQGTPVLLYVAQRDDPAVRRGGLAALIARFDPQNEKMVAVVRNGLRDQQDGVRHLALEAVPRFSLDQLRAVAPRLAAMLNVETEPAAVRAKAARLLGRLQDSGRPEVDALLGTVVVDPEETVRAAALHAAFRISNDAEKLVPVLRNRLAHDPSENVKASVVKRMGLLVDQDETLVEELEKALLERNAVIAKNAADGLIRAGEPALPAIQRGLASDEPGVRLLAVYAAGELGPVAKPLLADLRKLTEDTEPSVKAAAIAAISAIQGA